MRKFAQNIVEGDSFREYSRPDAPVHTVKRVLSPCVAGSWQSCRWTGFPRVETTTGRVVMLVHGLTYEVEEKR